MAHTFSSRDLPSFSEETTYEILFKEGLSICYWTLIKGDKNVQRKSKFCFLGHILRSFYVSARVSIFTNHRPMTNKLLNAEYEQHIWNCPDANKARIQTGFQGNLVPYFRGLKCAYPSISPDRFFLKIATLSLTYYVHQWQWPAH
jgi:hypothetical protein